MRLVKAQRQLRMHGVKFQYVEMKGLGRIYIGDKLIREHRIRNGINILAEEINLIDETQLIGWIDRNHDRLK